ncbi:DUF1471 domain-containing protein [Klebsiella sp. I138]|uniref:DUF1471 domain-containing protein n=1 Tax=Klebsiella sp. I138 TaxID=2755385 RepID=UPI003DA9AB11
MKAILISALLIGTGMVNAASAAQQVNDAAGKEKIGVVSASNAMTLDELSDALSRKADEQGASSYKILSATGNNRLHGVAAIYK